MGLSLVLGLILVLGLSRSMSQGPALALGMDLILVRNRPIHTVHAEATVATPQSKLGQSLRMASGTTSTAST